MTSRLRKDNVRTADCWEYQPKFIREECFWRSGNKFGLWVPDVPGLTLSAVEVFDEEEGSERDKILQAIRWG